MNLSPIILGSHTANDIARRNAAPILVIGRDTFTRAQLAKLGCFNFTAAGNLGRILKEELAVKDTRDLYDRVSPDDLVLPRLGVVSLAVLGAAFEAKGIGGAAPLEAWFGKHRDHVVTFHALKAHPPVPPAPARSRGQK